MAEKYIDWTPVSLGYINNKLNLQAEYIGSNEGLLFAENGLNDKIKSFDFNENSTAFLSELTTPEQFQTSSPAIFYRKNLVRNNVTTAASGFYLTKSTNNTVNFSTSAERFDNTFKIEFDDNDDAVSIVAEDLYDKLYLTISTDGLSGYFGLYSSDIEHLQKFKYILDINSNTLVLLCDVTQTSSYKVISYDENNPSSTLSAVSSFSPIILNNCLFNLTNIDTSIKTNALSASKYVKYVTNIENKNFIYNDLQIQSSTKFSNNYLFTIEYKNNNIYELSGYKAEANANNIALKNLFTPQYQYNQKNNKVLNRDYQNVFLGGNIINDFYNKATLTFSSSSQEIDLLPDRITYFHYPYNAATIKLSAAGFIEAGAIPGLTPLKSDRIWKAQHGYADRSNTGKANGLQNGLWLCSWLKKGSNDCNSIWMDRWFDPDKMSFKLALSADEPNAYVIDIPSTMTLDRGVLYKYFHIGKEYSLKLIEDSDFNGCDKILEIKNWTYDENTMVNSSESNITYTRPNESEFTFTGTEYITFSSDEKFYPEYSLSVASWVYFDNWSNAPADQILGNYSNGGYGISFDTGAKSDYIIFVDRTYGHIFVANSEARYVYDKSLPGSGATVTDISINSKDKVWILDDNQNRIFIYNPINNTFEDQLILPAGTYTHACHDKNDNFYVYDSSIKRFRKYSPNGYITSEPYLQDLSGTFLDVSILSAFPINGFFIDSNNRIQPYIGTTAFEDLSGNYWHHFGCNLTKNGQYILHISTPEDIKIDGDFNIWIVKGKTLYHIDKEGNTLLKKEYPYLSGNAKKLGITRELTTQGWRDFIWVLDSQAMIKYTSEGRFVKIFKTKDYLNASQYGDRDRNKLNIDLTKISTKYDFYRNAKLLNPGLQDNNYIVANYTITDGSTIITKKLKTTTNTIQRGWHHVAFVFDSALGTAKLYIDGVLKDYNSFTISRYKLNYNSKNNFHIANTNGFKDLKSYDWILDHAVTMVGKLDDIRVYNCILDEKDLMILSRKRLEFAKMPFIIQTAPLQYIEEIDKIQSHRTPGFKSNVYNIRILNSSLSSDEIKESIESAICSALIKVTPTGTKLNKIHWE